MIFLDATEKAGKLNEIIILIIFITIKVKNFNFIPTQNQVLGLGFNMHHPIKILTSVLQGGQCYFFLRRAGV